MNLKDALQGIIPSSDLRQLTKSYDIIGDIAVTIIPEALQQYELTIAQAIFSTHKNVKVILKRDGIYSGEHRTIPLAHIAGEKRTETLCTEFGVRLLLDLEKVYFSVRSGSERKRVAGLVGTGENVLVMGKISSLVSTIFLSNRSNTNSRSYIGLIAKSTRV